MKKWIYNVLLAFFAAVFLGSSAMLAYYIIDGSAQDAAYNALSQMREDAAKRYNLVGDGSDTAGPGK